MSCLRKMTFKIYVRLHKDMFSNYSYYICSSIQTLKKYLNERSVLK